jgi:hypothetical protein
MIIGSNYAFIQVPRTSSSSTSENLQYKHGAKYIHLHGTVRDTKVDLDGLFTFGFVRNPFEREFSEWKYHTTKPDDVFEPISFTEWVLWRYADLELPRSMFNAYDGDFDCYEYLRTFSRYPQLGYFLDSEANLITNFIGRFENREEDLTYVYDLLNLEDRKFYMMEEGCIRIPTSEYQKYYTNETHDIISERYMPDCLAFGYSFDKRESLYMAPHLVTEFPFIQHEGPYLHK